MASNAAHVSLYVSRELRVKIDAKVGSTVANVVSAESTAHAARPATADPQGSNNSASSVTAATK